MSGPTKSTIEFLSRRESCTLDEAASGMGFERRKVLRVLEKLRRDGFLAIVKEDRIRPGRNESGPFRRNPRYELIKDVSARGTKSADSARDKIWRTLRYLRRATRSDLIRLTGCSESAAEDYTYLLSKNGFIKAAGKRGREKVWFLVKDAGPVKPRIKER